MQASLSINVRKTLSIAGFYPGPFLRFKPYQDLALIAIIVIETPALL